MATHSDYEFHKKKHVQFFKRCMDVLPGKFSSLDTSRVTVAFFAICGLDVLDSLHVLDPHRQDIIDWFYSMQVVPNNQANNTGCAGFRGSNSLGHPFISYKETEISPYDSAHIAMTYTALASLITLGDDLSRVDKRAVLDSLRHLQLTDGSFCTVPYGSENDMRFIYCASCICYILDDWSGMDMDLAAHYIKRSLCYDGGIGQGPDLEAHGGSTFCALASLVLMDRLCTTFDPSIISRIRRWCVMRQQSGFQGRPNKPVDTCYSFWVGATLQLLGTLEQTNFAANESYVLQTQGELTGGFSKHPDHIPDPLHAYFGICGLSLLRYPRLNRLDAALTITLRSSQHLHRLQNKPVPQSHIGIELPQLFDRTKSTNNRVKHSGGLNSDVSNSESKTDAAISLSTTGVRFVKSTGVTLGDATGVTFGDPSGVRKGESENVDVTSSSYLPSRIPYCQT